MGVRDKSLQIDLSDILFFKDKLSALCGIYLSERQYELLQSRLTRRLSELRLGSFAQYRALVADLPADHAEWQMFINEMTTNKTDFFREPSHFEFLQKIFLPKWAEAHSQSAKLKIWSAACSTGEEAFTLAMVLDQYFKGEDRFKIFASDIDTSALAEATNSVYSRKKLSDIPAGLQAKSIVYGQDNFSGWGKMRDSLREKIDFFQLNLDDCPYPIQGPLDIIFCRNVFIYFQAHTIEKIVNAFYDLAAVGSILAVSHTETLQSINTPWVCVAPSVFEKKKNQRNDTKNSNSNRPAPAPAPVTVPIAPKKKRVLILDDGTAIAPLLAKILNRDRSLEVVGVVKDPAQLEAAIVRLRPDVLTLDIHRSDMDGCDLLAELLPRYLIPTVVISSLDKQDGSSVLRALELGAVDCIQKPSFAELGSLPAQLTEKIKAAANAKVRAGLESSPPPTERILRTEKALMPTLIAIGASTGGTEALKKVLTKLPAGIPPILIVQHIPSVFSKTFADRLNKICPFEVKEAVSGDLVLSGQVLIAPGGRHMQLQSVAGQLVVSITDTPPVNRHRPSIDVLFKSVAERLGKNSIGVILTGMGSDGAEGLLTMKQSGAKTIAQDEDTSVVFGMPKEAIRLKAAAEIRPLEEIPALLLDWLKK